MTRTKKLLGLVAGAVAVAAFALVVSVASPQTVSAHGGPGGRTGFAGGNDTYLADALGITAAELQTAQQEAANAAIDQAVDDGLITQAQADVLKQRSGGLEGLGRLGRFGMLGDSSIDMEALLADALGISVDELQAAETEAKDAALAAAVTAGNITQEQADQMKAQQALQNYFQEQGLQDKVRALYEDAVNAAVKAGVITQAQADQILSNQDFGFGMRGFSGPGGFGMHEGRGHGGFEMHGGRGFAPPSSNGTPTTPSTSTTPSSFRF